MALDHRHRRPPQCSPRRHRIRWNAHRRRADRLPRARGFRPFRQTALYVTVEDLEGFAAALASLGIAGTDARTGATH